MQATPMRYAPLAIIIEPNHTLAEVLFDTLVQWRFTVLACLTHAAAADAGADSIRVDLLVACHPVTDDDMEGAYLSVARTAQNGILPLVIMLSDPQTLPEDVPVGAVQLVKPFTTSDLRHAIVSAGTNAW